MSKEDSGWDVDSDEDLEEVDIDGTKGQAVLDLERTHTSDVVEESRQGDENFNRDVRKKEDEEKEGVGEEQEVADWSDDGEEEEDLDLSERLGGMTILEEVSNDVSSYCFSVQPCAFSPSSPYSSSLLPADINSDRKLQPWLPFVFCSIVVLPQNHEQLYTSFSYSFFRTCLLC